MAHVGLKRYVEFRLSDLNGNPVNGVTLGGLTVLFQRDLVACTDPLEIINPSSGFYVVSYTPTAAGHDYLDLYYPTGDIRAIDVEQIESVESFFFATDVLKVTQDYGGTGRLKPTIKSPETYTLLIFRSEDWQAGRVQALYAIASTGLDVSGNWLSTPLSLLKGTYHVVLQSGAGQIQVLFPFLQVA